MKGLIKMYYCIDLNTHSMTRNNKILIDHGIPVNGYVVPSTDVTFDLLDNLYQNYKHSVPSPDDKPGPFKALPYDELSTEDLVEGHQRCDMLEELAFAILIGSINKSLHWPDPNHWFWQSEKDPDFIVLRKWVIPDG